MKIYSSAFAAGETIPKKYACDGENTNPPLMFLDVPKQAKSLVLIVDDPDVPKNLKPDGLWNHWLIWNMPPNTKGIGEGATPPGIQGFGSGGEASYQGPCPPGGSGAHRYFFKLYALDAALSLNPEETKREDLLSAIKNHVLAQTEIIGMYENRL